MATLFLICGMAGAGKTTLARQMEKTHSALRLSPDEWIEKIIEDVTDKTALDRLRDPIGGLQWTMAEKLLRLGVNVILENGFWSRPERMLFQQRAYDLGARVELHYLDVSPDELWRRLEKRNLERPAGTFIVTLDDLELWLSWFEPPDAEELATYDNFRQ